jgi:hypothetical protein
MNGAIWSYANGNRIAVALVVVALSLASLAFTAARIRQNRSSSSDRELDRFSAATTKHGANNG